MNKYFKMSEFACPCCGEVKMSKNLLDKLEVARTLAEVPFVVNSGYRCEKHNKEVGGKSTSSHLKGLAVDIKATDSRSRSKVLTGLIKAGFNRLGIAKTFIHADVDESKDAEVVWLY